MQRKSQVAGRAPAEKSAAKTPHAHAIEVHGGAVTRVMTHEMGHGAHMDMQAMVRDMRKRFFIVLVFSVPIFVYSPMGGMFTPPRPPFGLSLELWLFFLASAAILYPSWLFFVAAYRALRNGVLNMAVLVVLSPPAVLLLPRSGGRWRARSA